ncbi:coenzyme Q-binding protein COQ10, mitochondrial [Leptidea sinapis]|uniref:coenzyme Q-binding protein COQ10, mitochondrial n=1 Tax=Leptidea sinapis TaxID=189913 RepID=UPI0021428747|nr:coenzyme Q-binding protein COQ10, mitochondrial [Leptidea sinapis]
MFSIKSFVARVCYPSSRILCFQGHYVNRNGRDTNTHCHCQLARLKGRLFFTLPKQSRQREYRGRQLVGYSMDQMFEVVSDVGSYYKFVPWCKKSIVLQRTPSNLTADLVVGFPPLNESYTSNVSLLKPHLVKAECTDGRIFNYLLTVWRFSPGLKGDKKSCVVDFQIQFQFRSAIHSHLSNLFFDQVARQMEGAFIDEVGQRYGPASMQTVNLLINKDNLQS